MKLKLKPYSLLIMLLFVLGACSKKTNVPVPADAAMVLRIDGASLNSKLSWDEFKKGELYKLAMEEAKDEFYKKILDNPEESGIDIKSDAYFFITMRGRGAYTAFTCNIKDEKAFTMFMSKTLDGKTVVKDGSLSVVKENSSVLTWDSKRFVFIGDSPAMTSMGGFGGGNGNSDRGYSEDSLVKFAKEIYDMKTSNSIGSNEKFASLISESADMHIWVNSGKLYSNTMPAIIAMTKASTMFEGNFTAAKVNFENGKISIDAKNYYNKQLSEFYKKYTGKNLDEEMLKKIPAGSVTGVLAVNYPPEGLKAFIQLLGFDGMVNEFLADMGYSTDEFVKGNKGDLLIAVSDFAVVEKEKTYTYGDQEIKNKSMEPEAKIVFASSVNDKTAFEKLMTVLKEKLNSAEGESFKEQASKIPYQLKDNWFVAGSDSSYVNAFGATSTNHPFISKISGHPMGGYVDIQKIITGFKPGITDSIGRVVADESAKFWQDALFYGGEHKDEAAVSHFEINLVDKNTNSLKQLHNYLGMIAKTFKEENERQKAKWDRTEMPPVVEEGIVPTPPAAERK